MCDVQAMSCSHKTSPIRISNMTGVSMTREVLTGCPVARLIEAYISDGASWTSLICIHPGSATLFSL